MIFAYNDNLQTKFRVFISSTFKDMQDERETIVNTVFPKLRKRFKGNMIDITEVDLRWGIPDNDIDNCNILEICIGEVLKCEYFLGLIGSYYGKKVDKNAIDNLPPAYLNALGSEATECVSITELEMRAGVFVPKNKSKSVFFIKKLKNIKAQNNIKETTELIKKIEDNYISFSYEENNMDFFENLVYKHLEAYIDKLISKPVITNCYNEEYYSHLRLLKDFVNHYVPNRSFIKKTKQMCKNTQKIYIRGRKGVGKSACVSWLIKELGLNNNVNIFFHYSTATENSININNINSRLKNYLEFLTGYKSSLEKDYDAIIEIIKSGLLKEKTIFVFDGMEQLNDVTAIYKLYALADMNPQIHVICSGTRKYININSENTIEVPALSEDQIRSIVINQLIKHGKKMDDISLNRITKNKKCKEPLFLLGVVSQLRIYADYDSFEKRLNELMNINSFDSLFLLSIKEVEKYFEKHNLSKQSVYMVIALIAYSHNGLNENDIQNIANILPVEKSIILSSIELYTIEIGGVIRFNHELVCNSVKRVLDETHKDYEKIVSLRIINSQAASENHKLLFGEKCFHYYKLNLKNELKQNILTKDCFEYLLKNEKNSLICYLTYLIEHQMGILKEIKTYVKKENLLSIADAFCQAGCYNASIYLTDEILIRESNKETIIKSMDILSRSQYKLAQNHYAASIETYKKLLDLYKIAYPENKIGYINRLYLMGVAYKSRGELGPFNQIIRDCVEVVKNEDVNETKVWILDVYGLVCYTEGDIEKAYEVYEDTVKNCKMMFGEISSELAWAYCYGWNILYSLGEREEAAELVKKAYEIYGSIYMKRGPKFAWACVNQATIKMIENKYDEAKDLYVFSIRENNRVLKSQLRPHVYAITVYCNLSILYEVTNKHHLAIYTIDFALKESIKKNGINHIYTANIFLNAGVLKKDPEIIQNAIKIYETQDYITPDVFFAKICLSRIYMINGDINKGLEEIKNCAFLYFSKDRETDLIKYLLIETLEKSTGERRDEIESLAQYSDYKFYLTHNNNSNIILIPRI